MDWGFQGNRGCNSSLVAPAKTLGADKPVFLALNRTVNSGERTAGNPALRSN